MDWTLEVVVLPVSDMARSIAFYRDQVGFHLDHDTTNEHMHVAQLTPPGSGCSIVIGDLPSQRQMTPGSMKALQLLVPDAAAARQELRDRGVECSEITGFMSGMGQCSSVSPTQTATVWRSRSLRWGDRPLIPPMRAAGSLNDGLGRHPR